MPRGQLSRFPRNATRLSRIEHKNKTAGHTGNGTCIRFVDECEFKVSVLGQRRLEKNRSPEFVLEPNCTEIIHYNTAEEKLKAVIEQANINHVHITTSARISIFLSQ